MGRIFANITIFWMAFWMIGLSAPLAQAQTPSAADTAQTATPDLSDIPEAQQTDALRAAFEARAKADLAILDALADQKNTLEAAKAAEEAAAEIEAVETPSKFTPDAIKAKAQELLAQIIAWSKSPAFLAQLAAIIAAFFLSAMAARQLKRRVPLWSKLPQKDVKFHAIREIIYRARNFLRPIIFVGLLTGAAAALKAMPNFGQDWAVKIAQGFAIVFLLFSAIKTYISNPLIRKLATWTLVPLALLAVIGYFDDFVNLLESTQIMVMGDTPITVMTLIKLGLFGGLFFWIGNITNNKGQDTIRAQDGLDVTTREVAAKMFQILLFIIIFVLVLSFAGIPLSGLVVIMSAIGLGIGFGLQPLAANFISGLIILFDRSVKVGDFISLEDGRYGRVRAINMRSTTVLTADGKDIMVPNTMFTESAYENWTHEDPLQRYEVNFTVDFETDLDTLEDILMPEILKNPDVLSSPDKPSLEMRGFGEFGVNMALEFWCEGIDDGPNKFTSDVNFIILRTLKANNIQISYPRRVMIGSPQPAMVKKR
ncbi:MAG: mechanosensitive ion channel family protein [Maricaulaceae bacterium]